MIQSKKIADIKRTIAGLDKIIIGLYEKKEEEITRDLYIRLRNHLENKLVLLITTQEIKWQKKRN